MSIFKRLFGSKKDNNDNEDHIVTVKDLKKYWSFQYDGKKWVVTEMSVYTWDNGVKDLEWKIKSENGRILYLNYEKSVDRLSIYKEGNINQIWKEGKHLIARDEVSDQSFVYKGVEYSYFDEGHAHVQSSEEGYTVSNWLFADKSENRFVSFNYYEDFTKDAYLGETLSDDAIKSIEKAKV